MLIVSLPPSLYCDLRHLSNHDFKPTIGLLWQIHQKYDFLFVLEFMTDHDLYWIYHNVSGVYSNTQVISKAPGKALLIFQQYVLDRSALPGNPYNFILFQGLPLKFYCWL